MSTIGNLRAYPVLRLLLDAGGKLVVSGSGEAGLERAGAIAGKRLGQRRPRRRVVADNGFLGRIFHLARGGARDGELNLGRGVISQDREDEGREAEAEPPWLPAAGP